MPPTKRAATRASARRAASAQPRQRARFLPPDPRLEAGYRLTPERALRLTVVGVLAVGAFAVLFLRLWSLQVLAGPVYKQAALENQRRVVRIEAPRGPILDREGRVLVANTAAASVELWPSDLPKRGRASELRRLARVLDLPLQRIRKQLAAQHGDPLAPVVLRRSVRADVVNYLLERQDAFPGVRIGSRPIRTYPRQTLAAQLLGYVREISPEQLKRGRGDGYQLGDEVGQAGVEAAFDRYLRGSDGAASLTVDSLGRPRGRTQLRRQPQVGNAVRLTIDLDLQRAAERALRFGIATARANKNWYADGGAIVALDPRDGSILAMASNPTYKPSLYAGAVDPQKLAPLADAKAAKEANYPILNRAVQGLYPPGSTFKPVTALAAMQEHLVAPYAELPCTPQVTIAKQVFRNWNPAMNAPMTLPTALAASCDTYFYRLGEAFYRLPPDRGQPLQKWAARFGFGKHTGVDVGAEEQGLLPTIAWRHRTYTRTTDRCCWQVDRLWKPGDSVQLAIGQKDLLVTPLQMARFYALIANGGKLVRPHLLADVEQPGAEGSPARVLRGAQAQRPEPVGVDPAALQVVREGLYQATHTPLGTSSGIFGAFPVPVAGKTGTAEKAVEIGGTSRLLSQSWWCGYAPARAPTIALCAVIENGGFGGEAAAPTAFKVLQAYFKVRANQQGYVPSD